MLDGLGADTRLVRWPAELDGLDGLVIPGGESTAIAKLLAIHGLYEPLRAAHAAGMAVFGTCAGAILMARDIEGARPDQEPLARLMDVRIRRNAYGRQIDSFETAVPFDGVAGGPVKAVFIRAPRFADLGPGVQVLAAGDDGEPLAVREGRALAVAFHPELTDDDRVHAYFLESVVGARRRPRGSLLQWVSLADPARRRSVRRMSQTITCPACGASDLDVCCYDSMMVVRADLAMFTLRCPSCGAKVSSMQTIPSQLREEVPVRPHRGGRGHGPRVTSRARLRVGAGPHAAEPSAGAAGPAIGKAKESYAQRPLLESRPRPVRRGRSPCGGTASLTWRGSCAPPCSSGGWPSAGAFAWTPTRCSPSCSASSSASWR